jgi:hypothetical protein
MVVILSRGALAVAVILSERSIAKGSLGTSGHPERAKHRERIALQARRTQTDRVEMNLNTDWRDRTDKNGQKQNNKGFGLCARRTFVCAAHRAVAPWSVQSVGVRRVRAKSASVSAPSQPPRLESDPFTALADARPAQDDRKGRAAQDDRKGERLHGSV